jgi:hypothetical protein
MTLLPCEQSGTFRHGGVNSLELNNQDGKGDEGDGCILEWRKVESPNQSRDI